MTAFFYLFLSSLLPLVRKNGISGLSNIIIHNDQDSVKIGPTSAKRLLLLGKTVTGSEINPCKGEDVLSCVMAKVDFDALNDERLILPGGVLVSRKGDIDGSKELRSVVYSGEGCEAVFSFDMDRVTGNIDYGDGSDFVLEPCHNFQGCHVWKEEDVTHMIDDEDEEILHTSRKRRSISKRQKQALRQQGINDNTTIVEFSIMFYYTIEFAEATDDIEKYFSTLVKKINKGYNNSNIPIKAKIFCIEATSLSDSLIIGRNISGLFDKFENYKGTSEELRQTADAAVLIWRDGGRDKCGSAYVNSWGYGKTISIVKRGCGIASLTGGHELGHSFGALHNREDNNVPSTRIPYPFGFGSFFKSPYRSIMSYRKRGFGIRANVYSSPNVKYEGAITGSKYQDNARVIKENRFGFAAVGDESGTCGGCGIKNVDCQVGNGAEYRGTATKTVSGLECVSWEDREHLGYHNNCRNPDGDSGVWCYTNDPIKYWELCDVRRCSNCDQD